MGRERTLQDTKEVMKGKGKGRRGGSRTFLTKKGMNTQRKNYSNKEGIVH